MKNTLVRLLNLQKVELLEKDLEDNQRNHPGLKQLYRLRETIMQQQTEYDKLVGRQKELECELSRAGSRTKEFYASVRQLEDRIYGGSIKNSKEIDKLQEKCAKNRIRIKEIEDEALTYLEEQETLLDAVTEQGKELSRIKDTFNEERLKIKAEIDRIKLDLQKVLKEKDGIIGNLPFDILELYNKVKVKKALPVAKVEEGQCTGCHMKLPIMLIEEVKNADHVIYCENCGRILMICEGNYEEKDSVH